MFEKIVVPLDFSENSLKLLKLARLFASKMKSEIHIVHVAEEEGIFGINSSADLIKFFEEVEYRREKWLDEIAEDCAAEGIEVSTAILKAGAASQAINEYIEGQGMDLGFISTVGIERIKTIQIGSTTKKLIRHARIPFITINQNYHDREVIPMNKILVCTDFSEASYRGIDFAAEMAELFDASLNILHVIKVPSYIPIIPGEPPLEIPPKVVEYVKEKFDTELDKVRDKLTPSRVEHDITSGNDEAETIVDYANKNDFDLIVIPKVGQGWLKALFMGRTAEAVVKLSNVPVVVFHNEDYARVEQD